MKIHAGSPARAACAATAFARLPVDAHPTVSRPSALAALIAEATTRSLNESDGCDTASFLIQSRATPSLSARRGASTNGVNPVSCESVGVPSNGSHSRYRHIDGARAAISARLGSRRDAGYIGSSGPRHDPQIASGAASNSAPHTLQCCGSARSEDDGLTAPRAGSSAVCMYWFSTLVWSGRRRRSNA